MDNLIGRICVVFSVCISSASHAQLPAHVYSGGPLRNDPNINPIDYFSNSMIPKDQQANCMRGEKFSQTIKGRGTRTRHVAKMSEGYFYGMAFSFAKAVCESMNPATSMETQDLNKLLNAPPGAHSNLDSLNRYDSVFGAANSGLDPLIKNYSILFPLGMLESSGDFGDGRDQSSQNFSALTTEAGLFQVSYNSVNGKQVPREVYNRLMQKYSNGTGTNCLKGVFSTGQKVKFDPNHGKGAGVEFQDAMKRCPALAVDYMSVLLRKDYRHNGPIYRREARPRSSCINVLSSIKNHLAQNPSFCGAQMNTLASDFQNQDLRLPQVSIPDSYDKGSYAYNPQTRSARYSPTFASAASSPDMFAATPDEPLVLSKEELQQTLAELYEANDIVKEIERESKRGNKYRVKELEKQLEEVQNDPENISAKISQLENEKEQVAEKIKTLEESLESIDPEEDPKKHKETVDEIKLLKEEEAQFAESIKELQAKKKKIEEEKAKAELDKEKEDSEENQASGEDEKLEVDEDSESSDKVSVESEEEEEKSSINNESADVLTDSD